jgi:hypothetical protein
VPPSVPEDAYSSNWSGYAVGGGPYTRVQGTFTVPKVTSAATCGEHVAAWVGIDGWTAPGLAPNESLIQAGIDESTTDPDTGTCSPGTAYVWPWWEILPAYETPITTVTVTPGDQVTVVISQVEGSSTWEISLTDDADGQSFTTDQVYRGPASSGEWVVEASSTSTCDSVQGAPGVCQLAPYCVSSGSSCTGPLPFSNMSIEGAATEWWQVSMVQNNATVATPSVLGADGFSVAYTGTDNTVADLADGGGSGISAGARTGVNAVLKTGSQPRAKVMRQRISER